MSDQDQAAAIRAEIARRTGAQCGRFHGEASCLERAGFQVEYWCSFCLLRAVTPRETETENQALLGNTASGTSDGPPSTSSLWLLIDAAERAAWSRKWSALKAARKALAAVIGKRPHFDAFPAPKEDA